MADLRQKIEILEQLNSNTFDYNRVPEYLAHTGIPGLAKPVLKSILSKLILLDAQVSASYDCLPEDEWAALFSGYDTPLPEPVMELRQKIEWLSANFTIFFAELKKLGPAQILEIVAPLFKNKTHNIQFIFFKAAGLFPRELLGFLVAKMRREPRVYTPFCASLLARLRTDEDVKGRCFSHFVKHLRGLKPSKNAEYVVVAQSLLYLLCFNKEYFTKHADAKAAVDDIFSAGIPSHMNKSVVDRFCDIFDYKCLIFEGTKSECLHTFPFDMPICKAIQDAVVEDYIAFG